MPVEALGPVGTVPRSVGLAYRSVGREAMVVDLAEERREVEGIGLGRVVEDHGGIVLYLGCRHGGRSDGYGRSRNGRDSMLVGRSVF